MFSISESRALRVDIKRDKEGHKDIQFVFLLDNEPMPVSGKNFKLQFALQKGAPVTIDPSEEQENTVAFDLTSRMDELKGEVINYRLISGLDIYATGRFFWGLSESGESGLLTPPAILIRTNSASGSVEGGMFVQGEPGKSAYEYAVEGGYEGTEEEFAEEQGEIATVVELATSPVEPKRTTFFDEFVGDNLFNPDDSDFVSGYFLATNTGLPTNANATFMTSGFIPVTVGETYHGGVNGSNASNGMMRYVCEYDSEHNRLAGTQEVNRNSYTPTNPATRYIRVSSNKLSQVATYHINAGALGSFSPWKEPTYRINPQYMPEYLPIQNDIAMPSKLYTLSGVQVDFFSDAIMKRWRPYDDDVRFSGTATYLRRLGRVASVKSASDQSTVIATLYNRNDFLPAKALTSTLQVSTSGVGSSEVKVQFLGDSWTYGGWYSDALTTHCPNVKLIGTRRAGSGNYNEGRGGWLLTNYIMRQDLPTRHNPFCQPTASGKRYWGSTGFWINAWSVVNGTAGSGSEPTYSTGRYGDYVGWFDDATGWKLDPVAGDIMYDTSASAYKEYDGSTWNTVATSAYTWQFNYGKYLEMYELDAPDFLFVLLGINDFSNNETPEYIDFTTWNTNMQIVADSYHEAVPGGKFVVVIPMSATGRVDNDSGFYAARRNAAMWRLRKNIIDTFDNRSDEDIYVLDSGISIDSHYGHAVSSNSEITKPFAGYSGSESLYIETNQPHPIPNYPASGICAAAFIQKHRG